MRMALARHPELTTVLVSHDSINRLLLLSVLGLPLSHYWWLEQSPCGVSVIIHDGVLWKTKSMNETGHLVAQKDRPQVLADTEDGKLSTPNPYQPEYRTGAMQ